MLEQGINHQQSKNEISIKKPFFRSLDWQSAKSSSHLYEKFIQQLVVLNSQNNFSLTSLLRNYLLLNYSSPLDQIDKLKTWLDSFIPLDAIIIAELKKIYDIKSTFNSNAIEGNRLTQIETEQVLTRGITVGGKTLIEHLEVVGHKEAIDYIETLAYQDTKIEESDLKQIHDLFLRKIDPNEAGNYRTLDIKEAGTNYLYPPHYLLPQLMAEFLVWLNSEETKQLHPVEYAIAAHYCFVSLHPFRIGNGQVSRLLMNLLLIRGGYPAVIINNQICSDYLNALVYAQQNQDDLTQLTKLICDGLIASLIETLTILVTASSSREKGGLFYQEISDFLDNFPSGNR